MYGKSIKKVVAVLTVLCLLTITGCAGKMPEGVGQDGPAGNKPVTVRIATQFGLGYAPIEIVKKHKLIEKYLPGARVEWKQLGTGGVIREQFISGDLDVGFMGIPPFLVAWDKGVDWKIAIGLCNMPQGLQTNKENINSLKDFTQGDKIAVPIVGSVQHILLAMAAERELGNPKALDNNLVSMTHPDGAAALISGEAISAHFTAPPFLYEELSNKSIKQVVDAQKAFGGEHSFLVGVTTKKFHDNNPAAYAALIAAVGEAISFVNSNPEETAKILAADYKMSEEKLLKYLTWPGTNFTSTPYGIMGFAEFMQRNGYIKKAPDSIDDIAWENVSAVIGKKTGGKSVLEGAQYRGGNP